MSTYNTYPDSPFKIKREGQEIDVRQTRLSPTTIRISWTIPAAVGCNEPWAYDGVIVTVDSQPTALHKLPVDGTLYDADNTANPELFAGDRIGSALVVGAFYGDITTTYVDVTDAPESGAYYASVHAVDQVHRYHTDGAHAYSLPYGKKEDEPTAGYQVVEMGSSGVFTSTPTGLNPAITYQFTLKIDAIKPDTAVTFLGEDAQTYEELVDVINDSLLATTGAETTPGAAPGDGTFTYDPATGVIKMMVDGVYTVLKDVITSTTDPLLAAEDAFWFDGTKLYKFVTGVWVKQQLFVFARDPRNPYCNDYWYDSTDMWMWNGGAWIKQTIVTSSLDPQLPPIMTCNNFWYHDGKLYQWDEKKCIWIEVVVTNSAVPPASPTGGQLWFDTVNNIVSIYDASLSAWVNVNAWFGLTDPSVAPTLVQNTVWKDPIINKWYKLDGTSWVEIVPTVSSVRPQSLPDGSFWLNTTDKNFYRLNMGAWVKFVPIQYPTQPNMPGNALYWFNPTSKTLYKWDGNVWAAVGTYSNKPVFPPLNKIWYNDATGELKKWNGKTWVIAYPIAKLEINEQGHLVFISGSKGSASWICISSAGNLWDRMVLSPAPMPQQPVKGTDPVSGVPSYMQVGVGTDGSPDERRELVHRIKMALGYPTIDVELTKDQFDLCVNMALEKLRAHSSVSYKRGYFALELQPRVQHYKLTDATVGFNKIVDVLYIYRASATFLGTAQGNSVYGQMMVQQLFNMGKFDLLSYHLVSSYVKTMQQLFAAEVQFTWNEYDRMLSIYKDFPIGEKVLVDAMLERTEQDLFTDRQTRGWIQKYATAQARYMLAEIRGKFSTLPGASGAVTLNASDLRAKADQEIIECMQEIDDYVVNDMTNTGLGASFVIG